MAKTREMQPKKQPEQWATNIRARIPASEIFKHKEPTQKERGMYAIMMREYAHIGPEYTLEQAKHSIQGEKWKQLFQIYAAFCGRIEHLLIIMMQANAPVTVGTQLTIKPDAPDALPHIPQEFDCYITEFKTTYLEKHKQVILQVELTAGTLDDFYGNEGFDIDNLPM